jgi:hypothetical protein
MRKLALMVFALGMFCTTNAQNTSQKYDTKEEMQTQMQIIVNTLGLDNMEVYQLGQIMEANRLLKEEKLAEIDAIKIELQNIEANKEKEIRGILTDDQWAKYQSMVKEKTEKVANDNLESIDE